MCQQETADSPKLGENVAIDESKILNLTVKTCNKTEFGFGATVRLMSPESSDQYDVVAEFM